MKTNGKLSILFEFTKTGRLKAIFLNAENDRDQALLERCLDRLIRPNQFSWLNKLLQSK